MSLVGIIANPASGKDIRRLVAQGRVVPNHEKVNIMRRVLHALDALGIEEVVMMPDISSLGMQALDDAGLKLSARILDMPTRNTEEDSTRATRAMAEMGAACLVTLGGDGTNRVVAKGSGQMPIVPISTGTNNVFPAVVEGTVAGIAAGIVAQGIVERDLACRQRKRLEVYLDDVLHDIALIDVAVSDAHFVGARAIWDMKTMSELFLTSASPHSIGLSSIGGWIRPISIEEPIGMYLRFGHGGFDVKAPVAPGIVDVVPVAEWRLIALDEQAALCAKSCTIALDGERQFPVRPEQTVRVRLSREGPWVVDIEKTLQLAANAGAFARDQLRA